MQTNHTNSLWRRLWFPAAIALMMLQIQSSCEGPGPENAASESDTKSFAPVRGLSFVGCPVPSDSADIADVRSVYANFIALMPFAYGETKSDHLHFKDLNWQWWGESPEGIRTCIKLAHQQGISCMIKPQIWFDFGVYTGSFSLDTDEKWTNFEKNYSEWILSYAAMAEQEKAAMLCIGTELDLWVELRPAYWSDLIKSIRQVYSGKLTYACNWDSMHRISFWKEIDYIGIDAYFPVSENITPDSSELANSWTSIKANLSALSDSTDRKILFTEWGYRSVDFCGKRPWEFHRDEEQNETAQLNCYKALMDHCCHEPWFQGGFVWKWFPESARGDRHSSDPYSPQDKPAEQLLLECWRKQSTAGLN
ncbi:MAG: hypothetical protein RL220_1924 [Bacteroidota bacterium]